MTTGGGGSTEDWYLLKIVSHYLGGAILIKNADISPVNTSVSTDVPTCKSLPAALSFDADTECSDQFKNIF